MASEKKTTHLWNSQMMLLQPNFCHDLKKNEHRPLIHLAFLLQTELCCSGTDNLAHTTCAGTTPAVFVLLFGQLRHARRTRKGRTLSELKVA